MIHMCSVNANANAKHSAWLDRSWSTPVDIWTGMLGKGYNDRNREIFPVSKGRDEYLQLVRGFL